MKKHGMACKGKVSKTYRCWQMMRRRCNGYTPIHKRHYTDRGIVVCERWSAFENFLADMGECPDGASLDRIDNDGNYEPSNCRWASKGEQMRNTSQNVWITFDGKTMCVAAWSKELGIPRQRIHRRLALGWMPEMALSTRMHHETKGRRKQPVTA